MEKIICLNQGSGSAWDEFNKLLANGWKIVQMQTGSSNDGACCFVWIKKKDEEDSCIK